MDLISATASVTQLVAYGHWSVKTLLHLYKVVTDGPAIYQDQKCNLMSLLSVIQKLSSQPDADGDIVLSVLDSLIETSNHLLSYLAPEKSSWYILLNKTKISKAFEYLREQREALQLSLSANNRELLLKIRSDSISSLDRQASDSMEKATETLGEHSKPAAENSAKIQAHWNESTDGPVMVANGWGNKMKTVSKLDISTSNNAGKTGTSVANTSNGPKTT